jgi:hypothetical protein
LILLKSVYYPQASLTSKRRFRGGTMTKVRILPSLLTLAILTLAGSNLFAQQAAQITLTKGSPFIQLAQAPLPGYVTLFSNLGPQNDAYDDESGWAVAGPDSSFGGYQNIAVPYTPDADSTIQGIQLAFEYYGSGTNAGAIAVFADSNGVPGKLLKAWNVSNLPKFGTCCRLVTVIDAAGIKVAAGTQIWIAAGTDKPSETAYDSWEWTYNDLAQGTYAFQSNTTNGVWKTDNGNLPAWAIYGKVDGDARR